MYMLEKKVKNWLQIQTLDSFHHTQMVEQLS